MAKLVENHMAENGITLKLGKAFSGMSEDGQKVMLSDGQALEADMVVLSIGVRPNNELAKEAGLSLSERGGGILVDEYMQTSDPRYLRGRRCYQRAGLCHGNANHDSPGRAGEQTRPRGGCEHTWQKPETYVGTMGTSILRLFDITAASVGANEKKRSTKPGRNMVRITSSRFRTPNAIPVTSPARCPFR